MRPGFSFTVLLLIGLISGPISGVAAGAQTRVLPESREQITLSFAPLVREVAPAVVNIYASRTVREANASPLFQDPFFRRFFGPDFAPGQPPRVQNSLGSGVIVRPDGLVVTNHHVVAGADEITVVLNDRREFVAELMLSDQTTDLALLRIDTDGAALPHLEVPTGEVLEVGDLVLAIGNPFGVGQTVTSGIVSALARAAGGISDYAFFIQTDAAINPGNSGGALVAMDGTLVGINTAIFSRDGGSLGIGFAIPASMVRAIVASADNGGRIVRPWLGAVGEDVTAAIAAELGLPRPGGVRITAIEPDGPAERAGLGVGDVVLAVNGEPVGEPEALRFFVATLPVGGTATLLVQRDGDGISLTFTAEPPPEVPPRETALLEGPHPLAGAVVANLSPALIDEIGYNGPNRRGVIVLEVERGSPAQLLGIQEGDVVASLNGAPTTDVAALRQSLADAPSRWRIGVQRGNHRLETVVDG